jgi:CDP-diglyceride synthetase
MIQQSTETALLYVYLGLVLTFTLTMVARLLEYALVRRDWQLLPSAATNFFLAAVFVIRIVTHSVDSFPAREEPALLIFVAWCGVFVSSLVASTGFIWQVILVQHNRREQQAQANVTKEGVN